MRSVPGLALTSAICDELANVAQENPNLSRLRTDLADSQKLGEILLVLIGQAIPDTVNLLVLAAQLKERLGAGSGEPRAGSFLPPRCRP